MTDMIIDLTKPMQQRTLTIKFSSAMDLSWLPEPLTLNPLQTAAVLKAIQSTMHFPSMEAHKRK